MLFVSSFVFFFFCVQLWFCLSNSSRNSEFSMLNCFCPLVDHCFVDFFVLVFAVIMSVLMIVVLMVFQLCVYDIQFEILKIYFKSRLSQWANVGWCFSYHLKLMKPSYCFVVVSVLLLVLSVVFGIIYCFLFFFWNGLTVFPSAVIVIICCFLYFCYFVFWNVLTVFPSAVFVIMCCFLYFRYFFF